MGRACNKIFPTQLTHLSEQIVAPESPSARSADDRNRALKRTTAYKAPIGDANPSNHSLE